MPAILTSIAAKIGLKGFLAIGAAIALGICWWGWSRAADQRDRARETIAELVAASKAAQKLAESQKAAVEQRYRELAERASNDHENGETKAISAADRYIISHGLRCTAATNSTSNAPTPSRDNNPRLLEEMPTDTFVPVTSSDLRACAAATNYAISAFEWANSLAAPVPVSEP